MTGVAVRASGAILGLLLAAGPLGAADEPPLVSEGSRVRVWQRLTEPSPITGSVRELGETAIVLQPRHGAASSVSIPLEAVERVQVSVGRHLRTRRGAFIGMGTCWSLVLVTVLDSGLDESGVVSPQAFVGTVVCAGLGALVGSAFKADDWRDAWLPRPPDAEPRRPGGEPRAPGSGPRSIGARHRSLAPARPGPTVPARPAEDVPSERARVER